MKDHLSLFTRVQEWHGDSDYYIVLVEGRYNDFEIGWYDCEHDEWSCTTRKVTHVLDLSKLTTKEELNEAVKAAHAEYDNNYGAADAFKDMIS